MKRSNRPDHCMWDGDCDHCGWAFCIATASEAARFYTREEAETRKRYGRGISYARGGRKLTAEERDQVRREIREGRDTAEIALLHGITLETVRYYRRHQKHDQSGK